MVARRIATRPAPFAIEMFLFPSTGGRSIVLLAPRVGALPTMVLSAAELAAQIPAPRVAGMREESNPAITAPHRTTTQIRTVSQDHVKRQLILTNKRIGALALVPIFREMEDLFES